MSNLVAQNLVEQCEQEHMASLTEKKEIPEFAAGDTVRVSVRVIDGATERIQNYEGVVIAKRNRGLTSSFVVRKVSHGLGVERRFMTYSPIVSAIKVVKRGVVRRAKLYYLRDRSGKAARIREKMVYNTKKKVAPAKSEAAKTVSAKAEAVKADVKDNTKAAAEKPTAAKKEAPKKEAAKKEAAKKE